jgi:hypothetical protein
MKKIEDLAKLLLPALEGVYKDSAIFTFNNTYEFSFSFSRNENNDIEISNICIVLDE